MGKGLNSSLASHWPIVLVALLKISVSFAVGLTEAGKRGRGG